MTAHPDPSAAITLRPLSQDGSRIRILRALTAYIEAADLGAGDKLPTERTLAAQLGVSRPTIREALQSWQAMGLIDIRKGSGTYLAQEIGAASVHMPVTIQLEKRAVFHLLELRRVIETDAARLAVLRGSVEDIDRLRVALEAMETAYSVQGFANKEDDAFHEALYVASGNPLYLQVFRQLYVKVVENFNASADNPFVMTPFVDHSQPDHRALYEAIAARDPDAAVAAVTRILDFVETTLRDDA
ncbi:FadR/GntR family transcriptional regulator [Palleronia sp. LCG004]|uniref:FadR/GntR family transcriptional regulator n=1 Tax=Palleronia sp. LCG004 TaxID=3079304 RepID=UPI0029420627|nr:FadR/GntR family transcriptional regulator [Palleronia sp. LCG004]WOI57726.1 FadR/GntR family transcriptional regulator [Palleronia sp. LCG004]